MNEMMMMHTAQSPLHVLGMLLNHRYQDKLSSLRSQPTVKDNLQGEKEFSRDYTENNGSRKGNHLFILLRLKRNKVRKTLGKKGLF